MTLVHVPTLSSPQSFLTVCREAKSKGSQSPGVLMIFADEMRALAWLTRPDQANYLPWNNNSWRDGDRIN